MNDQTHELLEDNLYLNHDVNDDLNRFDEETIEFLSLCNYLYHDVECKNYAVIYLEKVTADILKDDIYLYHDVDDDLNRYDSLLCRYLYHDVECK